MKLPKPFSWNRDEARSGKFDGKFLIGVLTTGIYCLPSCPDASAQAGKCDACSRTEAEAKAAGLRACKRCRPDLYYRGEDENVALFEGLAARVRSRARRISPMPPPWRKAAGVSLTKLGDLFRDHAHLAPAAVAAARAGAPGGRRRCWPARTRWSISASAPALKASWCSTASSWARRA